MKIKYILIFIFLSLSYQLLTSEKPFLPAKKPFLDACFSGDLSLIKKFFEQHSTVDINEKDENGHTALHLICGRPYTDKKRKREACKIVTMLIQKGANPNIQCTHFDHIPLHYACNNNTYSLMKILINNGTDVNKKDKYGETFLHKICYKKYQDAEKEKKAYKITKMLIQKGANPNIQCTHFDHIPLHYACNNNTYSLMKILINNGSDVAIRSKLSLNTPYQFLREPYIIRDDFSSNPLSLGLIYTALYDSLEQKNILATLLLPEIADIIKNFYLNLYLNDLRPEIWIWEPVCIRACEEAYKKDKVELDNIKNPQQCLLRVLFWPKEKKLKINATLYQMWREIMSSRSRMFNISGPQIISFDTYY